MSQRVIRPGHICPECDNGFVPDGECIACSGTGWIGREEVYVRDGWLYLPGSCSWINGARIDHIGGWVSETDPSEIAVYTITMAGQEVDANDLEVTREYEPDDFAAVTAWLEGRA